MRHEGLTMHQCSEWLTPTELGELLGRSSRGTLSIEEAAGAQIKKKMSYSKANPRGFYSLPICDEDHMAACGPSC